MCDELRSLFTNWDDEWQKMAQLLPEIVTNSQGSHSGESYGTDYAKGMVALRGRWDAKYARFAKVFPPDGRLVDKVDRSTEPINPEEMTSAMKNVIDFSQTLSAENVGRGDNARPGRFHQFVGVDAGAAAVKFLETVSQFILNPEEIIGNKLVEDRPLPDATTAKAGMKTSKYLTQYLTRSTRIWNNEDGYFRQYDQNNLDAVCEFVGILFSKLTESLRDRKEWVVLSINPIDIVLQSVHTTGWRSCHHIGNGEAKTAPIAMLCDDITLIAYTFREIAPLHGVPQPTKVWRQLVFMSLDAGMAVHGREYKQPTPIYSKFARRLSAKVLSEHRGVDYKWLACYLQGDTISLAEGEEKDIAPADRNGGVPMITTWMYRDPPTYRVRLTKEDKVFQGSAGTHTIPCMTCGTSRAQGNSGRLVCDTCITNKGKPCPPPVEMNEPAPEYTCVACAQGLVADDAYFHPSDEWNDGVWCERCYYEIFTECEDCGETFHIDDVYFVYTDEHEGHVCDECRGDHYTFCEKCEEYNHDDTMIELQHHDGTESVCLPCARDTGWRCNHGNHWVSEDVEEITMHVVEHPDGNTMAMCRLCAEDAGWQCNDCDKWMHKDVVAIDDRCPKCHIEARGGEDVHVQQVEVGVSTENAGTDGQHIETTTRIKWVS